MVFQLLTLRNIRDVIFRSSSEVTSSGLLTTEDSCCNVVLRVHSLQSYWILTTCN
jgi:hypothetical protein